MMRIRNTALVLCLCAAWSSSGMALQPPPSHRSFTQSWRDLLVKVGTRVRDTELDCSHFAHYVYEHIGLHYTYAESTKLYQGVTSFARVHSPKPGDLIVWRGHVGIIVDPVEHTFVSKLRSGVKVASYDSRYWKRRGIPRFFRYTGPKTVAPDVQFAQSPTYADETAGSD